MVTVINPIVDFHHQVIIYAGRTPEEGLQGPDATPIRLLYEGGAALVMQYFIYMKKIKVLKYVC